MKKKEQIDSDLQKIKDDIEAQKAICAPIKKQFDAAYGKLGKLENKLKKYRLEHRMFYPLDKLVEFKDDINKISSICFVQKTKNGKFEEDWIFNDDLLFIYDDGSFKYSSYENGIISRDKNGKWTHQYYGSSRKLDEYVGFMEIIFNGDDDKYDIAPPDVETYFEKKENK